MTTVPHLDLPRLLRDMDALKVERLPMRPHFAAQCDQHSRETYATLLAALLLADGELSETKSRLFKMLLASLNLGDVQARLFEQAQSLNQEKLREFFRVVDENILTRSFFMDALVLCRLDGPLIEVQHRLLSELADLLHLPEQELPAIANLAGYILGLHKNTDLIHNDFSAYAAWDEFIYKTLQPADLGKTITGGYFRIASKIEIDFPWSIENAKLVFDGCGEIVSLMGKILDEDCKTPYAQIAECELTRPKITLRGLPSAKFSKSIVKGHYQIGETAIKVVDTGSRDVWGSNPEEKIFFSDLTCSSENARSFLLRDTEARFSRCVFSDCGTETMVGGAIAVEEGGNKNIVVSECIFERCVAKIGGGIKAHDLGSSFRIESSKFVDCIATGYRAQPGDAGSGIFVENTYGTSSDRFKNCSFIKSDVQLGDCKSSRTSNVGAFCKDTLFKDSWLVGYKSDYDLHTNCKFEGGGSHYASNIRPENWWKEY